MLSSIKQRQHDQDDHFVRRLEADTDVLLQQTQDQQEEYALLQVTSGFFEMLAHLLTQYASLDRMNMKIRRWNNYNSGCRHLQKWVMTWQLWKMSLQNKMLYLLVTKIYLL